MKIMEPKIINVEFSGIRPVWLGPRKGLSRDQVELVDDCVFVIEYAGMIYTITVKRGFRFDGASIPSAFWAVIGHPLTPAYLPAACLHDASYGAELFPRAVADEFFHAVLDYSRVRSWMSDSMYRAVEVFGGLTWEHHTTQSVARDRMYCLIDVKEMAA